MERNFEEQITLSYSWEVPAAELKVQIDDAKKEERDKRTEAGRIPKVKVEGDVITELNRIARSYSKCKEEDAEIPPLE